MSRTKTCFDYVMARKHTFEKELKKKTRIINVKFKEVYIKWKRVESD